MTSGSSAEPTVEEPSSPRQSSRPTFKHKFEGHGRYIRGSVFLHDERHIVSGSGDGTMRKWDCETGLLVGQPWRGQNGRITALALSPDGTTIACGREGGSVEMWNTGGEMTEDIWMGHSDWVRSLSWSPNGSHISSCSDDGTILIRRIESGAIEVGPIETNQRWVLSLAYSPSGDRIASGGRNETISIWDSTTGELLVGPIENLGNWVRSIVWSSDGSKLYSASNVFARIFDSTSGTELHRFQHDHSLNSVALSSRHNLLACVGEHGVAQLWNTESLQPVGHPFYQDDHKYLYHVSFSQDAQFLAYGGEDMKVTLWLVKDIAPAIEPPSSSDLEVDTTSPLVPIEGEQDNIYDEFSQPSLPSPLNTSPRRLLWNIFPVPSLFCSPAVKCIRSVPIRISQRVFTPHALSNTSTLDIPANSERKGSVPEGNLSAKNGGEGRNDANCSKNIILGNVKQDNDESTRGKEPLVNLLEEVPSPDGPSPVKSDTNEIRPTQKLSKRRKIVSQMASDPSPKVNVYVTRVRKIVRRRKHKTRLPSLVPSAHTTIAHTSNSAQADLSHSDPLHAYTLLQGQASPSSQSAFISIYEGPSSQVSGSCCTSGDSDQSSWNKLLGTISCGNYHH